MLEQIARHGEMDLEMVNGDLEIDEHHTIEDVALTLGEAFKKLWVVKSYRKIRLCLHGRLSSQVAIDFGGRPWLV